MKTKSISLILVLAILITIGGVYAAWLYAETPLNAVHGHVGSFGLATAVVNNSKGTITVDGSNAHLSIDQAADNDYTAKLTASGSITVTFQPSDVFAHSHQDLTSIDMQYALVTTGDPATFTCPYATGDSLLFKDFDTTKKTITLTKMTTGENAGAFVGSIDAEDLLTLLKINEFKLDTIEKHTAFSAKVGTFGNIGVEITELPDTP